MFIFTASRYGAVLIPAAPGAVTDLVHNQDLAQILNHFIEEKSTLTFFLQNIPSEIEEDGFSFVREEL